MLDAEAGRFSGQGFWVMDFHSFSISGQHWPWGCVGSLPMQALLILFGHILYYALWQL
jgi:hypothetical protein